MKKNIYKSLILFLAVASLSSCLKDDRLVLDPEKGHNVIEFGNTSTIAVAGSTVPLFINSYALIPEATLMIPISYSGPEATAPQDITVDFTILGEEAVESYNDEQDEEFILMDPSVYSISSTKVVIPKGQSKAYISVVVKPNDFDLTVKYALPLKITTVSSGIISGNFGTAIYSIGAKNKYDGVFTYKTSANTSLVPNANKTVSLVTTGPNTVQLSPGLLGTYSNLVIYTIDAATNKVTVTCPSLGVLEPQDARSNWNDETKTLTVFWKQGNGARTFEETFVYKDVR